jgi:hypothetical protein
VRRYGHDNLRGNDRELCIVAARAADAAVAETHTITRLDADNARTDLLDNSSAIVAEDKLIVRFDVAAESTKIDVGGI